MIVAVWPNNEIGTVLSPFRRFPVQCSVTYNAGPFQGKNRTMITQILSVLIMVLTAVGVNG